MPIISVIVPVYGVESCLERCVDSLLAQSLRDIEIILVDDGSPDACGMICDRYAARDARVRVIHQENAGLSAARNTGLDAAQGEWIMFTDSDDRVEPDFCRIPYETALARGADLVMFGYLAHRTDGRIERKSAPSGALGQEEAVRYVVQKSINVWSKLYHRSLLRTARFPVGSHFEDQQFTPAAVLSARSIYRLDLCLYHYVHRSDSICRERRTDLMDERLAVKAILKHKLEAWGYPELAQDQYAAVCIDYLAKNGRGRSYSDVCVQELRGVKSLSPAYPWKRRLMLQVWRCSPHLFDLGCVLLGRRIRGE